MKELLFITGNKMKASETQDILGVDIAQLGLDIDEIQSLSLVDVATKKALDAFERIHKPLFVEDTGLFVEGLNGFPGPFIKFVLEAGGSKLLLNMMSGQENRKAIARDVIVFHDMSQTYTFVGEVPGSISFELRGGEGIKDWDPIFIPDGYDMTFAQLGTEEKNKISHRFHALEKFKSFLNSNS